MLYGSRIHQSVPWVKICSQALKRKVTSMLCVTDNKPELIPYSLHKDLQLLTHPGPGVLQDHNALYILFL